ncbi:MAG: glycosyltransferase family 2 protein [Acetobacter sp.]|nr:glycosyltransferase family 2 protein [Acetobacter sp.]
MKTSVVCFARDEGGDILSWISWYKFIGVDTIIIFDDGSSDGLSDVLSLVSGSIDIRIYKNDFDPRPHEERQQKAYSDALKSYGEEFDWMGFFDADEFLLLPENQKIVDFLDRPQDVGSVVVHWCNYGSSGHVFKPVDYPFAAYTWHSSQEETINRHIKSFVRPRAWSGKWVNVHYFDIGFFRHQSAAGKEVYWSSTKGITENSADWSGGKIMHYQCRSMENFVERARRRRDIVLNADVWKKSDYTNIEDRRPLSFKLEISNMVRSMNETAIPFFLRKAVEEFESRMEIQNSCQENESALELCLLKTMSGELLSADQSGHVKTGAAGDLIYALRYVDRKEIIHLFSLNDAHKINIESDNRILKFLSYILVPVAGSEYCSLLKPGSSYYISAAPTADGGKVVCNRPLVSNWETFQLQSVCRSDSFQLKSITIPEAQNTMSFENFKKIAESEDSEKWVELLPFFYYRQEMMEQERFRSYIPLMLRDALF